MPPGQHNYHWQLRLLEQENKIRLMESRIEEAKSIGICTKEFYRDLGREKYNKRCIELEALKQSDNAGTAREQPQVPLEQGNRKGSDAIELALSTAAVQAQEHQPHVPIQGSSTPTTRQLAVWFDKDGVPWTTFKWSSGTGQERVAYTMRCDICYTAPALSPEFKYANTLCSHQLETVKLGWKFAYLNPFLHRGKFQLHLLRAAVNHYKQLEAEGRLGPASFLQGSRLSNQSTNTDCIASQLCIEHMADAGGLDSDDRFASLSCLDFVEVSAHSSCLE